MKNKLTDLNDHLFAQIERLGDEGLEPEQLQREVSRAASICEVAEKIIDNANTQLKALTLMAEHGAKVGSHLSMIEQKK